MTELRIDALRQSLKPLREAWAAYQNNKENELTSIIADSCVQRYEYTLETAWKLMKKYLKQTYGKSDEELTINNIFRLAMRNDILPSAVENFIACADARVDIFVRNQIPEQFCENIKQKYYIVQSEKD